MKGSMKGWLNKGREYRTGHPVLAGYHDNTNADLFSHVSDLYIPDGARVLDMTMGKGVFWRNLRITDLGTKRFKLWANDIVPVIETDPDGRNGWKGWTAQITNHDFRDLSNHFPPGFFDVVVFDPPYKSGGGGEHEPMTEQYGLGSIKGDTASGHGDVRIVEGFYEDGFKAASQLLSPHGLFMVKCQDMVESGKQHWMHLMVHDMGREVWGTGEANFYFYPRDLFVLVGGRARMRHKTQKHARKNVSYLWVFEMREY